MRLNFKMYLLIFIGASVILYQYHLSKAWVMSQNNSQDIPELYGYRNEKDKTNALYNTSPTTIVSICVTES